MNEVAETDLEDVWACASAEALQPTIDLARKLLKTQAAWISSVDQRAIRCISDPEGIYAASDPDVQADAGERPAFLGVVMPPAADRDLGSLFVIDHRERVWTDEDRELLTGLAACLSSRIEWKFETLRRRRAEKTLEATDMSLLAAREDAAAARALRDKLLVDINCGMRTPLQAIVGFADFLQTERQPDRVGGHARNIRFAAQSLLAIINQLMAAPLPDVEQLPPPFCLRSTDLPAPYAPPSTPQHQSGARILLADDLDLNRKLITDMLSLEGYVVEAVADGAAAVEAARRHPYDLVLMDMVMPGMDGLEATRAIRDLPAPACHVPIVALTAHSLDEQLDSCLAAGMDATLTKPMSIDALNQAVSTWIRGRKAA